MTGIMLMGGPADGLEMAIYGTPAALHIGIDPTGEMTWFPEPVPECPTALYLRTNRKLHDLVVYVHEPRA